MIHNRLLLCLFGILSFVVMCTIASEAIVEGYIATVDQFKYQVSLQVFNQHLCGGAIITDLLVLTAAHCVVNPVNNEINDRRLYVVAGTKNYLRYQPPTIVVQVKKVYVTGEFNIYDALPASGDIAVVRLDKRLGLTVLHQKHLQKISLPSNKHQTYVGRTATIAGFGYNFMSVINGKEEGGRYDQRLRFANTTVFSNQVCQHVYPELKINDTHLCAKVHQRNHHPPSGVCNGDSGSPLVYDQAVIGILTVSPTLCLETLKPGIYTRVTHYLHFIQRAHKDEEDAYDFKTRVLIP